MFNRWLQSTRVYQAPDTPTEPVIESPKGDPHGDEVLESGADIPLVADPPKADDTPADPPHADPEPEPAKPVAKDWRDKEMARRARRIDEERVRAENAEAENKRLKDLAESLARQTQPDPANPDATPPAPRQPTPDPERRFTQAEVRAEAARIASEDAFKRDFNSAYEAGATLAGRAKMDEAIGRISELGGLDYDHLQMVLATDEPGKVLYELGNKPEEFQRIMELPFNRRVAEFVKMGLKPVVAPTRKQSGTPPPVEPISGAGGGGGDHRFNDKMSDDEWFAAEEKRQAAEYKRAREKRGY